MHTLTQECDVLFVAAKAKRLWTGLKEHGITYECNKKNIEMQT